MKKIFNDNVHKYIFDLDGTLVDTDVLWIKAVDLFLEKYGYIPNHEHSTEIVNGRMWKEILNDITTEYPAVETDYEKASEELSSLFLQLREKTDVRIPGSAELVRRLAKDAECCVVSGSRADSVMDSLKYIGIADCISFIISSDDCPRGKPDPCGFLMAAERMGALPRDCVVFEDSSAGIAAGVSAGMKVVALVLPDHPKQCTGGASLILGNLSEFQPGCI